MNKIVRYLKQPFPLFERRWLYTTIISGTCLLILAIFEPFNYRLNSIWQFLLLLGFVMVGFVMCLISYFLFPAVFKNFYNPERWTVGKNILHYTITLLIAGLLVCLLDMVILPGLTVGTGSIYISSNEMLNVFFIDMLAGITIGLIPVTIIIFLTKNRALHQNLKAAIELNQALAERSVAQTEEKELLTLAGNTKETIEVSPREIYYIEASGNYVEIYYGNKDKMQQKLLRATIKQIEEQLHEYPELVRCHRAFIVNSNHITRVNGNAQGYRLRLNNITPEIPVSRTYMKSLKETLS